MKQIFCTTTFRVAHHYYEDVQGKSPKNSFWNLTNAFSFSFVNTSDNVKETWASGVHWALTRMEYPEYIRGYNRVRYTGIIQDLIDGNKTVFSNYYFDENQNKIIYDSYTKMYEDRVGGYTIRQLEDSLVGWITMEQWKYYLTHTYENPTERYLDETFNFWSNR